MNNSYKIAIISGTGKVGRHIASKALENDYQVRMLVRNPKKLIFNDERVEKVDGDVQNLEDIESMYKKHRLSQININCPIQLLGSLLDTVMPSLSNKWREYY